MTEAAVSEAAGRWLGRYVGKQDPDTMRFSKAELLGAFDAGAQDASNEWAIEAATGQRQLDEALVLIAEAAALFTGYAEHHKARASEPADPEVQAASLRKAHLNLSMALSLREFMQGADATLPLDDAVAVLHRARQEQLPPRVVHVDFPGIASRRQAERFANREGYGNVRPITTGPLADPAVVDGIAAAIEPGEAGRALSTIRAHAFQLHTADPRFDPAAPVLINGFPFTPATESSE